MMNADLIADEEDAGSEPTVPVWAVFGDLMAGLLGAFVLILVCALAMQLDLAAQLKEEVQKRQLEEQRRSALEQAGCPIGVNDLHIAAHARSEGLTLVSNNLREFERVEALQLANWAI